MLALVISEVIARKFLSTMESKNNVLVIKGACPGVNLCLSVSFNQPEIVVTTNRHHG